MFDNISEVGSDQKSTIKLLNELSDNLKSIIIHSTNGHVLKSVIYDHVIKEERSLIANCVLISYIINLYEDDKEKYESIRQVLLTNVVKKKLSNWKINASTESFNNVFLFLSSHTKQSDWRGDSENNVEGIESIILKLVKKAPEGSSQIISKLFESFCDEIHSNNKNIVKSKIDFSSFIINNTTLYMIRMLKSNEESVVNAGNSILRIMITNISDPIAYKLFITQLLDSILGTKTSNVGVVVLTLMEQKANIYLVLKLSLKSISLSLNNQAASEVAAEVLSLITSAYDKEVGYSNKLIIGSLLGNCLSLLTRSKDNIEKVLVIVSSKFKTTISNTANNNHIPILLAMAESLDYQPELVSSYEQLNSILINLIKESTKKVSSVNIDALLSLRILIGHVAIGSDISELFEQNKIWQYISTGSFIYSKPISSYIRNISLSSDAASDSLDEVVVRIIPKILNIIGKFSNLSAKKILLGLTMTNIQGKDTHHINGSVNSIEDLIPLKSNDVSNTLIECALVKRNVIQRIVCESITSTLHSIQSTEVVLALLQSLWSYLVDLSEKKEKTLRDALRDYKTQNDDSLESGAITSHTSLKSVTVPSSSSLLLLVNAIVTVVVDTKYNWVNINSSLDVNKILLFILLISSHPFVSDNSFKRASNIWRNMLSRLNSSNILIQPSSMSVHAFHYLAKLSLSDVLYIRNTSNVAINVIISSPKLQILQKIVSDLFSNCLSKVVEWFAENIDFSSLVSFTQQEIDAYLNPGAAFNKAMRDYSSSATESINDIKITNADRKSTLARSSRKGTFGSGVDTDEWLEKIKEEKRFDLNTFIIYVYFNLIKRKVIRIEKFIAERV